MIFYDDAFVLVVLLGLMVVAVVPLPVDMRCATFFTLLLIVIFFLVLHLLLSCLYLFLFSPPGADLLVAS